MKSSTILGKVEVDNFGDPDKMFQIPPESCDSDIHPEVDVTKWKQKKMTSIHQVIYYSRYSHLTLIHLVPFNNFKPHLELFVEGTPNPNAFVKHLRANQSSGNTFRTSFIHR